MVPRRPHPGSAVSAAEQPAYTLVDAARYLKLPVATLRSWVVGRSYPTASGSGSFRPLIHPASRKPPVLSFSNLIEAHVLRALRTDHGVSVRELRQALRYAEETLGVERLLLHGQLCSEGGRLFLDRYGELINLSASGQLAMRKVFGQHLRRVERDTRQIPIRLYPFVSRDEASFDRLIAIDPRIAFGRPIVLRKTVSTHVIAERIDAGETIEAIAADYDLEPGEIEEAVVYERAA